MFSERLKLTRKRSGLSLRALSSAMGGIVSAQAIGKYERAEMKPSSTVAIALAKALEVPPSYLLSPSRVSLERVEFRKLASTKAKERAAVEGEILDRVDRYLQIEEILGLDIMEQERPNGAPYRINAVEEAERVATRVRKEWNLGGGSIPDITELLEERGIKVFKWCLPGSVDGLSCRVYRVGGDDVPVVVCSTGKSPERQRFTIAHELGHLVLDIPPTMPAEKACQRFAGAFLAPGNELVREVGRRRLNFGFEELIEIKHIFGISAAALVMRMRDLGIITEASARAIFGGIGRGWRTKEPNPLKRTEYPTRFRRLCLRALAENEISVSKAAELLRLRVSEIEGIMAGTAGLECR
ncbi:MAG: helix-turn-helix domain-containing protein [Caldilineaceae bacterium SB0662_bin_9]|uniref:Helix-turn-helix domain-containing protein n=1 Tax=Caldilineaceae bacterium SB0662_bin_9 TaxID=2605258 RepID=A0A6B1DT18_9CHLR|nr:helix-turn-helix domain-containing protein [Caldilineaceae bacterium SB0662_bin_9]